MKIRINVKARDSRIKAAVDVLLDVEPGTLTLAEARHLRKSTADNVMKLLEQDVAFFSPSLCDMKVKT